MKKVILLFASITCFSFCGFAQSSPDAGSPSNSGQTAGAPTSRASGGSSTMTVDGCLSGSAGHYMLKDKTSGTSYMLTGATAKLEKHVGHEVQVTGTMSSGEGGSETSGMNTPAGQTTSGNAGMNGAVAERDFDEARSDELFGGSVTHRREEARRLRSTGFYALRESLLRKRLRPLRRRRDPARRSPH